jgi:hypothetical protein
VASACPSRRRHAKSSHAHHTISCANVQLARVLGRHLAGAPSARRIKADRPSRERGPVSRRDRGAPQKSAISRRKAVARLDRGP